MLLCTVNSVLLSRLQVELVQALSPTAELAAQKTHAYSHGVMHGPGTHMHACSDTDIPAHDQTVMQMHEEDSHC